MIRLILPLFAVSFSVLGPLSTRASETILRKGEKPISGEVTGVSRTEVSVKLKSPRDEALKIPANEVQTIVWTGEAPDANLARSDEAAGRLHKALDEYQKSLSNSKSGQPAARADLEFAIARTTGKLALADPGKIDDAIRKLEEFRAKQSDHYRYYDAVQMLGQLHLARKDFVKAQLAFDNLAKAPWDATRNAAKIGTAHVLAADNKPDEALAAFDAVLALPAEGAPEQSQRQQAMLGKCRVLLAQRKHDEAQRLLEDVLAKVDPDDAHVNAEAYVRLGDCLRELGKDQDALLAYLHVDILFPSEKDYQAEALFHLVRLWEKAGYKGRSAEARDKLESDEFKGSAWARQLTTPAGG